MHSHTGAELPLTTRIFAVLAAVLLVGAVALASVPPSELSLGQAIHAMDGEILFRVQAHLAHGIWEWMVAPFLIRPVWMIPACLGLLCVGGAISALKQPTGRATRKRS